MCEILYFECVQIVFPDIIVNYKSLLKAHNLKFLIHQGLRINFFQKIQDLFRVVRMRQFKYLYFSGEFIQLVLKA